MIILYNIKYKPKWIYDFSFYSLIFITSYNFETSANENKVSVGLSKETELLKILQWKAVLYFKHGFINIFLKVHLGNISHFICGNRTPLPMIHPCSPTKKVVPQSEGNVGNTFFRGKTPNTLIEVKREVRKTPNLMTSPMTFSLLTFPVVPILPWSLKAMFSMTWRDVSYGSQWKKTEQEKNPFREGMILLGWKWSGNNVHSLY